MRREVVNEMKENETGRLKGRTAIVTGSTYGIGEAFDSWFFI